MREKTTEVEWLHPYSTLGRTKYFYPLVVRTHTPILLLINQLKEIFVETLFRVWYLSGYISHVELTKSYKSLYMIW